jgi:hypothetical protein
LCGLLALIVPRLREAGQVWLAVSIEAIVMEKQFR